MYCLTYGQTTVVLKPNGATGKDVNVFSNNPAQNYANHKGMAVYTWTNSGALGIKRAYIIFPLGNLPSNAIIDSALLSVFYNPSDENEGFDFHMGATDFFIERVTGFWTESTITWNNQPNTTAINRVAVPAHTVNTQDFLNMDVSALVDSMHGANQLNYGFCLKMQNELNPYRGILIASSEHADSSLWPRLKVVYHLSTDLDKHTFSTEPLAVYPNPSSGIFNLNWMAEKQIEQIEVVDLTGRLVYRSKFLSQIDLSEQAPGVYFLSILNAQGQHGYKKLVISGK